MTLSIAPLYLSGFWLQLGFLCCAAAVAAIGLGALSGVAGQLSLGHAFFVSVGAITYCTVSGVSAPAADGTLVGLGLPPVVGLVAAVATSGLAGLVVSPVTSRLRHLQLGIATLGLVYVGQHVLNNVHALSGGYNGRTVPDFELLGIRFAGGSGLSVAGVAFGRDETLWYLGCVVLALSALFVHNALSSPFGRALRAIRDDETRAAACGVRITSLKARAFVLSSSMAGLGGVLLAIGIGSVAPENFGLDRSIEYLVMIIIGGSTAIRGPIIGALFVTSLPLLLQRYSASLPLDLGAGAGISPGLLAKYFYGVAIIATLLANRPRTAVARGPSRVAMTLRALVTATTGRRGQHNETTIRPIRSIGE